MVQRIYMYTQAATEGQRGQDLVKHIQTLLMSRVGRLAASCLAASACEAGTKSSLTVFTADSGRTPFNCKTTQQSESGHTVNQEHRCTSQVLAPQYAQLQFVFSVGFGEGGGGVGGSLEDFMHRQWLKCTICSIHSKRGRKRRKNQWLGGQFADRPRHKPW